ncbi:MAG: hypothetical protein AAFP76_02370 [Bacteroidota bacterium]
MNKYFCFLFFIIFGLHADAQSEKNDSIIDGDKLSRQELYSLQSKGWMHMKYRGMKYLLNLSNKDYILHFSINCKDSSQKPGFLIEFSNNYRDGTYGGIDFASSELNTSRKIEFFIDGQEFQNPFEDFDETIFKSFKDALKEGKILTIKCFDLEFNTETGKDELELNRELKFMLANGKLLDEAIDCMK